MKSFGLKKDSLAYFALRFALIAVLLLFVFHIAFPFYRNLVGSILSTFSQATNLSYSGVSLVFMPFVSVSALILATPKRVLRDKIKYLALIFVLFFAIDISFSIIQLLLPSVHYNNILIVQDFFTIAMPIVIWFLFAGKSLSVAQSQKDKA